MATSDHSQQVYRIPSFLYIFKIISVPFNLLLSYSNGMLDYF